VRLTVHLPQCCKVIPLLLPSRRGKKSGAKSSEIIRLPGVGSEFGEIRSAHRGNKMKFIAIACEFRWNISQYVGGREGVN
jgi:hypothetical protein